MCAVLNVLVKSFNFIDAPQPVSLARSRRRQAFDRREVRKREMQFRLKVGIFLMIFFLDDYFVCKISVLTQRPLSDHHAELWPPPGLAGMHHLIAVDQNVIGGGAALRSTD